MIRVQVVEILRELYRLKRRVTHRTLFVDDLYIITGQLFRFACLVNYTSTFSDT